MKYILFLIIIIGIGHNLSAQVFLQLEKANQPKSKRIYTGDKILFTTKEYPDVWRKGKITEIFPERNIFLLEDNYYKPRDLYQLGYERKFFRQFGGRLMQFSAVWFVYGGLASITPDYNMSPSEAIIGGSIGVVGFLMSRIVGKRKVKLGGRNNLRILDIRF